MDISLKTYHSYVSAIVHRPLLLFSHAKHHVHAHARFCIVNSEPAQSVRVYDDLMGKRTNTVKLNWLLYNVVVERRAPYTLCYPCNLTIAPQI